MTAGEARDQLGHWVAPHDMSRHPCPHSCCQWKRVHPENLPVKLGRKYLRSLSADELETELSQYSNYQEIREHGWNQILTEIDRRDMSEKRAAARKLRARERRMTRNAEYSDEVYRQWLMAESATNGYMLNKAGLRAGINERSLFTGPEARVRAYASPELIEWFEHHPRPTRASWFGSAASRRAHLAGRRIG